MKNPFVRWLLFLLGGAAALSLVAAGALFYLMSRFDARAEIERAVHEATGRDLVISGKVGITFYPVIGLAAHDAALANVEGGRAPAFVRMDAISIGVEIGPLLERKIEVRSLVLDHPQIALEIDDKGAPNWILKPQTAPQTAPGAPAKLPDFSLAEVRINDGELSFYDGVSKTGWVVSKANFQSAFPGFDQPLRVTGDAIYNASDIAVDLTIDKPRAAFAGESTNLTLALTSDLLEARFVGQTKAASAELNGDIRAHGANLKALAAWAGAPIEGVAGLKDFAIQGRLTISGGQLAFANAAFVVDRLRGRGDFNLIAHGDKPYVSGRLELFDLDFNPYLTGAASDAESIDTGEALTAAAAGESPAIIEAATAAPRALDVKAAPSEAPIDFSALKALNADLEIVTHALRVQSLSIDGSQVTLVLNNGFLAATLHRLTLYGGSARGRLMIDAREDVVKIDEDLAVSNVDANTFLSDAANFGNLEGRADLTLGLRSQGRTQSEFISAVDGRAHIEVVSGALRGVDLGGVSRTISNAMRGELVGPNKRTPFDGFSADFSVADGEVSSDSLSFNTPDLRITGLGVINLGARRLDLRLAPRSPHGGIVFPFTIRGAWDQPLVYNSDIRGIVLRELTTKVEDVKTRSRIR